MPWSLQPSGRLLGDLLAFTSLLWRFGGRDVALYVGIWADRVVPYNGNEVCAEDDEFLVLTHFHRLYPYVAPCFCKADFLLLLFRIHGI